MGMKTIIIVAAVILTLMTAACGSLHHSGQIYPDGVLEHGVRVIEFGFADVHAYRGETVRLLLRSNGELYLYAPEFNAQAEGYDEIFVEIKAVQEGAFDIIARTDGKEKRAKLVIAAYKEQNRYESVDAAEFKAAMTGQYLLLDVRSQSEYDRGHIDGALLIPHTELKQRIEEIGDYDKVLVYCASGNRSVTASQILIDAGVGEVYDLAGGYAAWRAYKGTE